LPILGDGKRIIADVIAEIEARVWRLAGTPCARLAAQSR
jgi:hypothetical protein